MSAKMELLEKCKEQLMNFGESANEALLENIIEAFGPSAFNEDAQLIAFSDEEEVERFKNSNVNGKLGVMVDDEAVDFLKSKMGPVNHKLRIVAYYLLMTR